MNFAESHKLSNLSEQIELLCDALYETLPIDDLESEDIEKALMELQTKIQAKQRKFALSVLGK